MSLSGGLVDCPKLGRVVFSRICGGTLMRTLMAFLLVLTANWCVLLFTEEADAQELGGNLGGLGVGFVDFEDFVGSGCVEEVDEGVFVVVGLEEEAFFELLFDAPELGFSFDFLAHAVWVC